MFRPRLSTFEQVMFFDTDCGGVVHNIAYLRFIETNRTLLAEQLGMGLTDMAATQIYPVVVRTEVDYRKPARLADKLQVDGWLERIERLRFWVAFTIMRPADGVEILRCQQVCAVIQMPAGKPLRLPADWAAKYGELQAIAPPGRGMR